MLWKVNTLYLIVSPDKGRLGGMSKNVSGVNNQAGSKSTPSEEEAVHFKFHPHSPLKEDKKDVMHFKFVSKLLFLFAELIHEVLITVC